MADISFLKIHPNKDVAWNLGDSPQAELHYTRQIQLKPLDPKPYFQVTASSFPLTFDVENYEVYLVRCRDGFEEDITANVQLSKFVEGGIAQLIIRLAYLPTDHGTDVVYLKIVRDVSGVKFYYSNRFIVTNYNIELTSRIDYVDVTREIPVTNIGDALGFLQSIRLRFYFDNPATNTEVETYTQITRGNQTINARIIQGELKQWKTQLFNKFTYERLSRALYGGICYIDFVRNYIIEGMEPPRREGQSNISEMEFITDPNDSDTITIVNVIIGTLRDWVINISNDININDPNDYLISETQIP